MPKKTVSKQQHTGRFRVRRGGSPGSLPGTVSTNPGFTKPVISFFGYGPDTVVEQKIKSVDELQSLIGNYPVSWINMDGLGDGKIIETIGKLFNLHPLALEDVVNVHQRPKVEQYPDHLFIILRTPLPDNNGRIESEQFSIFLGKNFVITFQEKPGDCLEIVRDQIRNDRGRIRDLGPDYLAYALMDASMDYFFPILENYGERLEKIEDVIMLRRPQDPLEDIHEVRHDLLSMRRAVWPMRESLSTLQREQTPLISKETLIYLRDCLDHASQLLDNIDSYGEVCEHLMQSYLSYLSVRSNEVMKVLTIFAAIFMPLTFIVGIYGMNFNTETSPWNMPELNWYWGYVFSLILMLATTIVMIAYFKAKGWLWAKKPRKKGKIEPPEQV